MATTRDQVAAYDYESRRRVTSLVLGADEAGRDPRRRLNRTLFGSAIVAVITMAAFGIVGWLGGGRGPALPQSGAVVVKGSGDRYVISDHVLHPALNLSSAMLVGGGPPTVVRPDALNGIARGLPVGIPNAPDGMPRSLTRGAWTVCAKPPDSERTKPPVSVLIGLSAPQSGVLQDPQGVVVSDGNSAWLVTAGQRFQMLGKTAQALNLAGQPLLVPGAVLNTIPEGPRLLIPTVPRGGTSSVPMPVDSPAIGDLIRSDLGGVEKYYLVREDGVAELSALTYTLLLANNNPTKDATGSMLNVKQSAQQVGDPGWPRYVPRPVLPQLEQPLCVTTIPGAPAGDAPWRVTVSVPPGMPEPPGATPVVSKTGDLVSVATSVTLAPGTDGALVRATTSAGQDGAFVLVTETGQQYRISSADATGRLGYDPNNAVPLPLPFVNLLPAGPTLDPDAAAKEYTGSGTPN
jgi:ESX secretion system ATPase EccB